MDDHSVTQKNDHRKKYPSASRFTASELAELAGFDAALDQADIILTMEERALSRELDLEALGRPPAAAPKTPQALETAENRKAQARAANAKYRASHKEWKREYDRRYREAHREEIRARQRTYDAAHRDRIRAWARANYQQRKNNARRPAGREGKEP